MRLSLLTPAFFALVPALVLAERAPRVVTTVLRGPHAAQGVATEVMLPPSWKAGEPALLMIFLHDGRGSERSFRRHGLAGIAAGMMQSGTIPPMIIASPRHRGTFIVDGPRAEMESFVADDLVPALERAFPGAGGSRERRSVWGISMGGYGALKIALRHPEVFGRVGALAPWVQPLSWDAYEAHRTWRSRRLLEPVFGRTREESRFEANDLYRIAATAEPSGAPPILMRTGSLDRWEPGALSLVAELRRRGFVVDEASVSGAKHRWADWRRATPAILEFLARVSTAPAVGAPAP